MFRSTALPLALVATACSPWTINGGDEEAPWTPFPAATPPGSGPADAPQPADPGALGGLVNCLRRCDAPGLTRVARAECRYRCEDIDERAAEADALAEDIDPVETVARCMTRCPGRGGRIACLDACERLTADSPVAPPAAVLDELGACFNQCHLDHHLNPTGHGACELHCVEAARSAGPNRPPSPRQPG